MIDDDAARREAPYGTWESPVGARTLTERAVGLSLPQVDGADVYWLEDRPEEAGRTVLVRRRADGTVADVLTTMPSGEPVDVRSRVHEYGGAAYSVRNGVIVLSHAADGRLYRVGVGGGRGTHASASPAPEAVPLTPPGPWRFADPVIDLVREVVYAVREDHGPVASGHEPVNELVRIPLDGSASGGDEGTPGDAGSDGGHDSSPDGGQNSAVAVVATGTDFVISPTLSPDGARLAWVSWDHPHMPWTSSSLHVAELTPEGLPTTDEVIAGGDGVSVAQPLWTQTGDLVHVDDRTGWWNLYRTEGLRPGQERRTRALHPAEMEFTAPQWRFGPRTAAVLDEEHLVCSWTQDGRWHLGSVRLANGAIEEWSSDWEPFEVAAGDGRVVAVAASPLRPPAVIEVGHGAAAGAGPTLLRRSSDISLAAGDVAVARAISWETPDGAEAHGFFYPPTSSRYRGPAGERPPLLVLSHGGPTSATRAVFSLAVQFWTTRGFAVLDVNYGGSTGYGRAYRERLDGAWGVVDVADCASGAEHLAEAGLVDRERLGIRGGSAGGFTTLAALTFTDTFTAGASRYGIGDLEALARDTHKFESRYPFGLVGPYPEAAQTYRDRSPVHHTDRLSAPMVLLQGTEDKVVPPNQAGLMADAVRAKGLPVAVVMFEGEGHGFRRAENIEAAVLAELSFYGQVWGFEPAGDVPRLPLENVAV
jgi:dipeptidyl aminopeptidase/acylaminoacyl peptidase